MDARKIDEVLDHRAERLRSARQHMGMLQSQAALKLGISVSSLGRYEQGVADIPGTVICRMSALYDVSADYLLCLTDDDRRKCVHRHFHEGDGSRVRTIVELCDAIKEAVADPCNAAAHVDIYIFDGDVSLIETSFGGSNSGVAIAGNENDIVHLGKARQDWGC